MVQLVKKVVSDSPKPVDFVIRLVNSVLLGDCNQSCSLRNFFRLIKLLLG